MAVGLGGLGLASLGPGCSDDDDDDGGGGGGNSDAGTIARENQLPGDASWRLEKPAQAREIEGYAEAVSVLAGESVGVRVSLATPGRYRYRVFRMGYYDGAGGRLVAEGGPLDGETQAEATFDPVTGLVEAPWSTSFTVTTSSDGKAWPTGVYLIKLETAEGRQSYVIFVVRDDSRDADVLVKLSTATYQAYNDWGGESLYLSTQGLSGEKARKVSYDRPYTENNDNGAGHFFYEQGAVAWLEAHGYDVTYTTDLDAGGPGGRIGEHRLVIALGHDEYATSEMFDRMETARDRGTSFAFLSGNTMYWQVRYEDGPSGRPNRVLVCYKDKVEEDPLLGVDDSRVTTKFRNVPVNRPENGFLGVISTGRATEVPLDWIVDGAEHWIYEGTGLANGDVIPGVIDVEWDSFLESEANPAGLTILARSPLIDNYDRPGMHNATIYEKGKAFVFAAGSVTIPAGLAASPALSRMLENAIGRAGARRG